mgnify:FL=1
MYTIIGGNPFTGYTGTTSFTSLKVLGKTKRPQEVRDIVNKNYENCSGLILVIKDGKEVEYDAEGKMILGD